ncbi:MAG: putative zinc-binding metallopeptidase [Prevotellaceae bacterium]|nr:putative zinc-binding metallopeptidase [Prevotellaceae bacterium]
MKKIIIALCLLGGLFAACQKEDELNPNSIFDTTPPLRNELDVWLIDNYLNPYNVEFKYRMEDFESSLSHTLAPADYHKAIVMAKLVKHLWFEAYDEARDIAFTRKYSPRIIHLIGSRAYNPEGTYLLGQAEGGLKVTLFMINEIDVNNLDIERLNEDYFNTIHHEFGHILHQTVNYDPNFKLISEADYVSSNWYLQSELTAFTKGFVSPYAMNIPDDDFVETFSRYLTYPPEIWEYLLTLAGSTGRPIIEQKFNIVKDYMKKVWNIDIEHLKSIIQRRSREINALDYQNLN